MARSAIGLPALRASSICAESRRAAFLYLAMSHVATGCLIGGFLLVSATPAWQADFGFYPDQESGQPGSFEERVESQVAAVRTLFSLEGEAAVGWVDVRDPRRVYWRP